jgi:hypothetical protein
MFRFIFNFQTIRVSFGSQCSKQWNALPTDVQFSKNIKTFKNSLDSIPKLVEQFYGVD